MRETGEKYGEEVCEILFSLGMPDVPSEVFPEGVKESCKRNLNISLSPSFTVWILLQLLWEYRVERHRKKDKEISVLPGGIKNEVLGEKLYFWLGWEI